jgi:hypothetical protein
MQANTQFAICDLRHEKLQRPRAVVESIPSRSDPRSISQIANAKPLEETSRFVISYDLCRLAQSGLAQHPTDNRFLRVQTIFRLIKNGFRVILEYLFRDFFAAIGRQTM